MPEAGGSRRISRGLPARTLAPVRLAPEDVERQRPSDLHREIHLTRLCAERRAQDDLYRGPLKLECRQDDLDADAPLQRLRPVGHEMRDHQLLEGGATVGERLLRLEESEARGHGHSHLRVPEERETHDWKIGDRRNQGEAFLQDVAPLLVARDLCRELALVQEDEPMVGDDMDSRVSPAVELTDEPSQPFDLEMNVSNQVLGIPVANLVDSSWPKTTRRSPSTEGAAELPSTAAISRQSAPNAVRNARRLSRTDMSLPSIRGWRLFPLISIVTTRSAKGRSAVIPMGVTVGSTASTGVTSTWFARSWPRRARAQS